MVHGAMFRNEVNSQLVCSVLCQFTPSHRKKMRPGELRHSAQKPNSLTYNFVEVSGHNLESSRT
jgi:hypothetical protein